MDLEHISLQDCPICGGAAAMFEEGGWAFTIQWRTLVRSLPVYNAKQPPIRVAVLRFWAQYSLCEYV